MRNQLNGALSLWTRINMSLQGILILIKFAVGMAVIVAVLALMYTVEPQGEIGAMHYCRYRAWQLGTHGKPALQLSRSWAGVLPPKMEEVITVYLQYQELLARDDLTKGQQQEFAVAVAELNSIWKQYVEDCHSYGAQFLPIAYLAITTFILSLTGGWLVSRRDEKIRHNDRHVRGGRLTTSYRLNRMLRKAGKGIISLGGVRIPRKFEIGHFIFLGRPQQGKSVGIKQIMDQVMIAGNRMIVFDSKGDFTSSHYRQSDLIFAPAVDSRTIKWNLFNDLVDLGQVTSLVAALIPEMKKDMFWSTGARRILEGLIYHCLYTGKKSNRELWNLCNLSMPELKFILDKTPGCSQAAALLDRPESQTSFGFFVNIMAYLKPIQLLAGIDGDFSIRKWLAESVTDNADSSPGNIFITSTLEHQEILRPVHALFLSVLINAHLSLPDDRERRIFYFLDELPVLNQIPRLMDALNFGASKGLCAVIGAQALSQLDEIYSREVREAIYSAVTTHVAFSVGSKITAEEVANLIGRAELDRSQINLSVGITATRDGATSMEHRVVENVVMPEQIKDQHPLEAYLKVIGYPAAKVKFTFRRYPVINTALIPDPSFDVSRYFLELKELENRKVGVKSASDGGRGLIQEGTNQLQPTPEGPEPGDGGGFKINLDNLVQQDIDQPSF